MTDDTTKDKKKRLADYLNGKYVEFVNRKGRVASMAEFARWLGVTNYGLSQWTLKNRLPDSANIDRLAVRLGPEIYELLGVPERMPDDPEFKKVARDYFEADDETRRQIRLILDQAKSERPKRKTAELHESV